MRLFRRRRPLLGSFVEFGFGHCARSYLNSSETRFAGPDVCLVDRSQASFGVQRFAISCQVLSS